MKLKSTLIYYLKSIKNLIAYSNFWIIPLVFFKPVVFKTNNFSFFVRDFMDIWTIKEVVIENCYQQNKKINKNDIVIDIGAGIGDFSILAMKNGAKKVYGIEMNKKALFFFKRNITLNNVNNVIIVNKKIKSLNNLINNKKINFCHFLKIDCEGCEFEIFKDISKETLKKIGYIVCEIHIFNKKMTNQYAMLKQKLIKNNFLLLEIENPVHQYLKFLFAENKFKTKNEKNKKIIKVGFDLDGVLLYNPARIFRPIIYFLKKYFLKRDVEKFYYPNSKLEQFIWLLLHKSSLFLQPGIKEIKDLIKQKKIKAYIVSARYEFLEKDFWSWVKKIDKEKLFSGYFFNKKNEQPYLYKAKMIKKLGLDIFVEDNWDIVKKLKIKNQRSKIYWIYNLLDRHINYPYKFPNLKQVVNDIMKNL